MGGKKKHPAFTTTCGEHEIIVRAKTPEKAAMKVFRMHKADYDVQGYVEVFAVLSGHSFMYSTSNWCAMSNPTKFATKPKSGQHRHRRRFHDDDDNLSKSAWRLQDDQEGGDGSEHDGENEN